MARAILQAEIGGEAAIGKWPIAAELGGQPMAKESLL